MNSGYVHCSCRDCPEVVVGDDDELCFCDGCEKHDCEEQFHMGMPQECRRPDAYGVKNEDN